MKNLDKFYAQKSKEFKLTRYQVEDIFKSQFELVAKEMEAYSGHSVRLPYIGVFIDNKIKRAIININKKKKDERESQQSRTS